MSENNVHPKIQKYKDVARLYDEGFNQKQISEELDITPARVSQIVRELNLNTERADYTPVHIGVVISEKQLELIEDKFWAGCLHEFLPRFIADLISDNLSINYNGATFFDTTKTIEDISSTVEEAEHLDVASPVFDIEPQPEPTAISETTSADEPLEAPDFCPKCGSNDILDYGDGTWQCNECLYEYDPAN